jgi:hypothetical protein
MRPLVATAALLAATALAAATSQQVPRREIDHVAAFARLYGVARYFYPSDAAAGLDWDAFAIHGVRQARAAADARSLETTLEALFVPLGPGIEIGQTLPPPPHGMKADPSLVAWRYLGAGFGPWGDLNPYKGKRTNRAPAAAVIDGFVTMMQTVPALPLRGRPIRLRGQVRATPRGPAGSAALWLRVDRADSKPGFFDNMGNRPVREPEWREYRIEGTVADDAINVSFGAMASGAVTADFDAIELSVGEGSGSWSAIPIADAGFESADSKAWFRAGVSRSAEITRVAGPAPDGSRFLRFSPPSGPPPNAELFEDAPPLGGAHVDVDLGVGLKGRVALALSDGQASGKTSGARELESLRAALGQVGRGDKRADPDTRLADVVVAWNVLRHFYPYWNESRVDCDGRLRPQLELAHAAATRRGHRDALRQLVADARDGHGNVVDTMQPAQRAVLPVRLGVFGDQLGVTASGVPADVPVGAVVSAIDGVPVAKRMAEAASFTSGTMQWKQARALQELALCEAGSVVNLSLDGERGSRTAAVRCDAGEPPEEARPGAVSELQPGVWYVDLTRASMSQLTPALEKLARASGVVFDLRGYPTDAGARILPHLMDAPEADRWMHVARIVGPFGQSAGWQSVGWNLKPANPRIAGTVVFLTDGRAISYAESVMGYVADRRLATIVGSTTAGTNGNVVTFTVPGGFTIAFTGMRVTGHDGQAPHHLVGVRPDIVVVPTLAALLEGRDEVLQRALAVVRGR